VWGISSNGIAPEEVVDYSAKTNSIPLKPYAKKAHPLHSLTRKGALFSWIADCVKLEIYCI